MTNITYSAPSALKTAFNCPYCSAFAKQDWHFANTNIMGGFEVPSLFYPTQNIGRNMIIEKLRKANPERVKDYLRKVASKKPFFENFFRPGPMVHRLENVWFSECQNCKNISVWVHGKLVFPVIGSAPPPNADLPNEILNDYQEAASISNSSPRGAAALLRLIIQKMCILLGEPGKNLSKDIDNLDKKGLRPDIKMALELVRVIGNNAVHPGELDITDDISTVDNLFVLVNMIADDMISKPKILKEQFESLPKSTQDAIKNKQQKS